MYITKALHHLSMIDPAAVERERQDIFRHQAKVRTLDRLDALAQRVATCQRRLDLEPSRKARQALGRALERHRYFTAAAARDGLTIGKDRTQ